MDLPCWLPCHSWCLCRCLVPILLQLVHLLVLLDLLGVPPLWGLGELLVLVGLLHVRVGVGTVDHPGLAGHVADVAERQDQPHGRSEEHLVLSALGRR